MKDILKFSGKTAAIFWVMIIWTNSAAFSLTFEELQKALQENPDAQWTAENNNKSAELGIEGLANPFGLEYQTITTRSEHIDRAHFDVPEYLDWRNMDGKNFVSPIRNQGKCGSCVAFAAIAALETQYNIAYNSPNLNLDFSEQNLFANIGNCITGSSPDAANSMLKNTGVPDETCQPYVSGRLGDDQEASSACSDLNDRRYKVTRYESYSGDSVKLGLQKGPLTTTMGVYEDLMFYKGGIYQHVAGDYLGGHAVTIVGYDDANDAWIVKNSWGEDWGEKGFFRAKRNDDGNLGNSGDLYTVNVPQKMIKLTEPDNLTAGRGKVRLKLANLSNQKLKEARFEVKSSKNAAEKIEGIFTNNETLVDTTKVSDGIFQIKIWGTFADNTSTFRPWFSLFFIKNKPANLQLTLEPYFDVDEPASGRVYFVLKTKFAAVSLTDASIYFKKKNDNYQMEVKSLDPGAETQIGWRTAASPDGIYDVYVIGRIGKLESIESNHLTVKIKNQ